MANPEHLKILQQGVEVWNIWRSENPEIKPDLIMATLISADLSEVDLSEADLSGATMNRAILNSANLIKTNLKGADLIAANLGGACLSDANLHDANLLEASLKSADLIGTNLSDASLSGAELSFANLIGANLSGANLSGAELIEASMLEANLIGANLSGANLIGANLSGAILCDDKKVGPAFVDSNLKDVNLLKVDWSQIEILGDEYNAKFDWEYNIAVRAYRQICTVLREQGLTDEPNHFAFRAQVCNRKYLWLSRQYSKWAWSAFLNLLTGYGYKLGRAFLIYFLFIFFFAFIYWFSLSGAIREQRLWESIVEAVVGSINAFHGRSVTTELSTAIGQNWGYLLVSGIEAVFGLIIEVALIATITKRLFSS